jgi:nitrogenase-stabilizing/protective protein
VVNVNRLHILKQFSQYMEDIDANFPDLDEADRLVQYRDALIQAYEVFLTTSPLKTKLFKVFNEKPKGVVMLSDLSGS